jgi:NAD(P)-dependent dehydrogenase (short-subunit alcohol dehydrogenase family)
MLSTPPVALVTGAARGIGRGIAVELARVGFSVAINDICDPAMAEECRHLCAQVAPRPVNAVFEFFQANIAQASERSRLLAAVRSRFGWIDLLVNNAGVAPQVRKDLLETDEESFDRLLAVNLKGPFFLTQAVANFWLSDPGALLARARRPKIVTISSVSAYAASVNRGEYCVSKAALSMLTPLFAVRLAEYGIQVFEIRPGVIATDMTAPVKEKYDRMIAEGAWPLRRWGTPEDVGRAVATIAEERLPFSTGEVINVDGGFHLRQL